MLRHPFFILNVAAAIVVAMIGIGVLGPLAILIVVVGIVLLGLIWRTSSPSPSKPDPATVKHDEFGYPLYPVVSMSLRNGQLQQDTFEFHHPVKCDSPEEAVKKLQSSQWTFVALGDVEKVITRLSRR